MATNSLPSSISELLSLASYNLTGITALGGGLGLLQFTAANFSPKIAALQDKQAIFNTARASLGLAFDLYHTKLDLLRADCLTARKILSISFGDDWSAQWSPAGWTNNTTQVPQDAPGLQALGTALAAFLDGEPDYEIASAKVTFNSAQFTAAVLALANTEPPLAAAKAALGTARDDRKADEKTLRTAMRGLIDVLATLLGPDDPRWDQFGLNRPGASTTPAQPTGLTLQKIAPGTILAQCDPTPTATYYRWKYKVVGVDSEFRFWGRTSDPMVTLTDQPTTGTLQVKAEAANEAGAGQASDTVSVSLG